MKRNRWRWPLVVACLSTVLAAGCGQTNNDDSAAPSAGEGTKGGSADRPSASDHSDPSSPGGVPGTAPSTPPTTMAGAAKGGTTSGAGGTGGSSGGATTAPGLPPPASSEPREPAPGAGKPQPQPQGGLLTAGTWDDNLNFDFYARYHTKLTEAQTPGLPQVPVADRLVVTARDAGGNPVPGARLLVKARGQEVFHTTTGGDGRAIVLPRWLDAAGADLEIEARTSANGIGTTVVKAGAAEATVRLPEGTPGVSGLDVALVIDTTGSMGDEIRYLQAEMQTIAASVKELYPTLKPRWALVAYKDVGDPYVVKPIDFVDDLASFQTSLAQLEASGGGDTPESPEKALAAMDKLAWRDGAVARVAFWVADAPHHVGQEKVLVQAIRDAQTLGVHLYPVAASGSDPLTEFSMRLSAFATGGRYLFLTDDSGIGGAHMEPTIPCYWVTSLQKAMLRMLVMELTGTRIDPAPADVLRTGGDPKNGRCTLGGGEEVSLF